MFAWLRNSKRVPHDSPERIVLADESVRVLVGDVERSSFQWEQLVTIHAWKQDRFAFDQIWLGFETAGRAEQVCVHEEMKGFDALVEEMGRRCPGIDANWLSKVARPPFAENYQVIWHRVPNEL